MSAASANLGQLLIAKETTYGILPVAAKPDFLRFTSESIAYAEETTQSEELRKDRQVADLIATGSSVSGDINFEFSNGSFDQLLEGALGSTFDPTSKELVNGVENHTFAIEKGFTDVNQYAAFLGMGVSNLSLNMSLESIVTGTVSFLGATAMPMVQASNFTETPNPVGTDPVIDTVAGFAELDLDGDDGICAVSELSLSIATGLRERKALGKAGACEVLLGTLVVTGEANIYFEDATIYNKVIARQELPLSFSLIDNAGNGYKFEMPRVRFSGGTPLIEGQDTDVTMPLTYQALPGKTGPNAGVTLRITKLP